MNFSGMFPGKWYAAEVLRSVIYSVSAVLLVSTVSTLSFSQSLKPEDPKKLTKEGIKLTRDGKLLEAEAVLRRAAAFEQGTSKAKVELAYALVKQRALVEAYEVVFPIAKAEPTNARAFAVLGLTFMTAGRFADARLVFYNALKLDKKQHLGWAGLGLLDFYENNLRFSLANLDQAIYFDPHEPDYLFAYAQVASRAERYAEAAEAYDLFLAVSHNADSERRARIKGLIEFLKRLGQVGSLYVAAGKEQTQVPFELIGNRPIIKLHVNGHEEPLTFVLDTGSGVSVISEKTAKRLKIKPIARGGFARGIGGNGKFEIVYGLLREIKVGDVSLKHVPVYLRKFHDDSLHVDGYIGLGLISKFLTTVDYGSRTLALTRKDTDTRDFKQNDELSLPLRITSSGFLSGEVQLQGLDAPLNFIVDTGASVSVISNDVAKADGISGFINPDKLRVIGSAGITNDVYTYQLPKITFGKHSRKDITAVALDLDLINEAAGFEQSGILGGNFLRNYRLTFDFKNSKVIFDPVVPDKQPPQ
ncbi:MAG: aspartyl protease family protein [Pyrinomonadaceae bacterium]